MRQKAVRAMFWEGRACLNVCSGGRVYAGNETGKNDKRRRETMMGVEHLRISKQRKSLSQMGVERCNFFFWGGDRDEDEGKGNGETRSKAHLPFAYSHHLERAGDRKGGKGRRLYKGEGEKRAV